MNVDIVIDHHPLRDDTIRNPFADLGGEYGATSTLLTEYVRAARGFMSGTSEGLAAWIDLNCRAVAEGARAACDACATGWSGPNRR